jgi:hypothetical protein
MWGFVHLDKYPAIPRGIILSSKCTSTDHTPRTYEMIVVDYSMWASSSLIVLLHSIPVFLTMLAILNVIYQEELFSFTATICWVGFSVVVGWFVWNYCEIWWSSANTDRTRAPRGHGYWSLNPVSFQFNFNPNFQRYPPANPSPFPLAANPHYNAAPHQNHVSITCDRLVTER